MRISHWALLLGGLALAGCGRGGERAERSGDTAGMMGHMDSGRMEMGGRPMPGMQMMLEMRAHMDSMMRMSPQQMQAMMARHQSMMSRMLDGMGADMRGMKMSGSAEWTALTDSVKQDLAELSNLSGQQLSARMRAHVDRLRRLLAAHEQMMKGMP
jgi:hypothetical protein